MITCRRCKKELNNGKFSYYNITELNYFQRETCNNCWKGVPYANRLLRSPKESKKFDKAIRHFSKKRKAKNYKTSKRRADELQATPKWADTKLIKKVYSQSVDLSVSTGIEHHVDHIVPLKGKKVCGLHVHYNLRVIPAIDNLKKGNRMEE